MKNFGNARNPDKVATSAELVVGQSGSTVVFGLCAVVRVGMWLELLTCSLAAGTLNFMGWSDITRYSKLA